MMRPIFSALLAAGAVAAFVRPVGAAMHATKEFEAGDTRPKTIAFLPPHATLIKRKVIKAEEQLEEGAELSAYLASSVKNEFAKQGYEVRMLTPDEVNANHDLQELVLDADRRYTELLNQVRLKLPKQIAARRYQAGDEMRVLAGKLGVDAIGFADLIMIASAPGALFLSGSGTQQMLTVSVIDGSTATIEAYFVPPVLRRGAFTGFEAVMADPAGKIGEMAALTLRDLPPAAATARAKAETDKDVVSDVEQLLKK
ncbi:MAG TPA: hypothetical protein VHH11_10580 [Gammaproteobacteria bacterium]|nr:hypothetical protein [Gammaproteobacteria bacterium]